MGHHGWMDECVDGWMDGLIIMNWAMDNSMKGWIIKDGWMDGSSSYYVYIIF